MVLEEVAIDVTSGLESSIASIITFIKIVGWIVVVYIVFWMFNL